MTSALQIAYGVWLATLLGPLMMGAMTLGAFVLPGMPQLEREGVEARAIWVRQLAKPVRR